MTDTTSTRPQMGDELLPCPFCGSEAEKREEYDHIAAGEMGAGSSAGSVNRTYVACSKCGARTQAPNPYSQFHWNTRTDAGEAEGMRQAAAKIALNHSDGGGGEWDSAASTIYDEIVALSLPQPTAGSTERS